MGNKDQERILVPSDYFFWFLIGVVVCFAVFSFWSFKVWQVFAGIFILAVAPLAVKHWTRWIAISFAAGLTVGFLRILFWGGDGFVFNLPAEFLNFLEFISLQFSSALAKLFPEPVAGFSQGIILGGKDIKFSNEFWQALKITSTAHLIAVSGYNITLIARGVTNFLIRATLHRKLIWIFTSIGVVLFVAFVGAPASAARAGILSILMLIAQRFGRENNVKVAFVFALAAMSFFDPLSLKNDLGLQLSFLASFGIFYVAPLFLEKEQILQRAQDKMNQPDFLKQTVFETLSAQLMVLPLLLFKFGTLSLTGVLANFILVPWIWLAMGFSFFAGLGMIIFAPLGRIIGFVSYPFLNFFVKTIEFFAGLPLAGARGIFISPLFLALCYLGIFWFLWRIKKPAR